MEIGCQSAAARKNETVQGRDIGIHRIDFGFETLDLRFDNSKRLPFECLTAIRRREIRAEVKQVILNASERRQHVAFGLQRRNA